LTVADVDASRTFYTEILGFQVAIDGPPPADHPDHAVTVENLQGGIVLTNGDMLLGLRPAGESQLSANDRFDPFRIGLDHLSFRLEERSALEAAVAALDEHGVPHGPVTDLAPFGISVMSLKDPDGIQIELTAPLAAA
jgi:catechol 2,3-dioxygenase-like lactoylglutathione lyase family enzyme